MSHIVNDSATGFRLGDEWQTLGFKITLPRSEVPIGVIFLRRMTPETSFRLGQTAHFLIEKP